MYTIVKNYLNCANSNVLYMYGAHNCNLVIGEVFSTYINSAMQLSLKAQHLDEQTIKLENFHDIDANGPSCLAKYTFS